MLTTVKKFLNRPLLKEVSWYTAGQIAVQFFSFLSVMLTSRYLGPTNLGIYSFVQNYLLTFTTILTGFDFYFIWGAARSERMIADLKEYTGHKLIISSIITIVGIIMAWSILPHDVALYATIVFLPFVLSSASGFSVYAVVTQQAKRVAVLQVVSSSIAFVVKAILVFVKAPLIAFVIVSSVEGVLFVTLIFISFLSVRSLRLEFNEAPFPSVKSAFTLLYKIRMHIIVLALWQFIVRADQFVLAAVGNAYTLGVYVAAVKIAEIPNFFAGILNVSLVSRIASFVTINNKSSNDSLRVVFFIYFLFGVITSVIIIVLAPLLVHFLYGDSFSEAVPALRMYALSIPGMFLCLHYFAVHSAGQKYTKQAIVYSIGIIINVSLIYILFPYLGIVGASLATVIAYTVMAVLLYSQRFYQR